MEARKPFQRVGMVMRDSGGVVWGGRAEMLGYHKQDEEALATWSLVIAAGGSEIYMKAMTMGDDEFFATNSGASSGGRVLGSAGVGGAVQVARNPLSLDELVGWSSQLMNLVFASYWRGDQETLVKTVWSEGGGSVRCTWEGVREKMTNCLAGIHARDFEEREP
ncbi:hypothetical protein C0995_006361 [Termitomyces sp. Mi166|nr:hypothetical protein C0995_006361 [Termitomyces sp. Mi166\